MSRAAVNVGETGIYDLAVTIAVGEEADGGLCLVVELASGRAVGVPLDKDSTTALFSGLLDEMATRGWLPS